MAQWLLECVKHEKPARTRIEQYLSAPEDLFPRRISLDFISYMGSQWFTIHDHQHDYTYYHPLHSYYLIWLAT